MAVLFFICVIVLIICLVFIFSGSTTSNSSSNGSSGHGVAICLENQNLLKYNHVRMEDESNNDLYNTLLEIFKSGQTYDEWGKENGFVEDLNNTYKIEIKGFDPIETVKSVGMLVNEHFENLIENVDNEHDKDILDAMYTELGNRGMFLTTGKGLIMNPREECYFRRTNSMCHTIQTLLRDISYSGFKYGKGMLRAGNMFVSKNDITGWKEYTKGTMYVTNQRVIIIGVDNKTKNIPLGNIANYSVFENNGIIFTLKNGNPVIFSLPMDGTFHFNTAAGTLFEDDMYPCLMALEKAFNERLNKGNENG